MKNQRLLRVSYSKSENNLDTQEAHKRILETFEQFNGLISNFEDELDTSVEFEKEEVSLEVDDSEEVDESEEEDLLE